MSKEIELKESEIEKVRLLYGKDSWMLDYTRGPLPKTALKFRFVRWLIKSCLTQQPEIETLKKKNDKLRKCLNEIGVCTCKNPVYNPPNRINKGKGCDICGRCKNVGFSSFKDKLLTNTKG